MIHGFKGKSVTTAEEWLIDYSLKTGNAVNVNTDLLDTPIIFDGKEVDAFILDIIDNKLVIQLALPIATKFDDRSGRYETSYVRKLINSNEFLNRFNQEFVKHIQLTKVYTEDYVTNDKLWLLSHEEVNSSDDCLKPNHKCISFEMFKAIDLEAYSRMLLELNVKNALRRQVFDWRLRSTYSTTSYTIIKSVAVVGGVGSSGYIYTSKVNSTLYGALCPACTIC